MPMRVLVTGGCGFVGTHLCKRLLAEGYDVRALALDPSDFSVLNGHPITPIVGDITDATCMQTAVAGCDWVIHAAASIRYWSPYAAHIKHVNIEGTRIVARACREAGVKRMLFVSSVLSVGLAKGLDEPADEEIPFNLEQTSQPYPLSKYYAERALQEEITMGLDAVTVNPVNIFGPRGNQYHGAEMMQKVRQSYIIPYYSGGICVVHVADIVDGIIRALVHGTTGERYILGGENISYRSIVERTATRMGLNRRFVKIPPALTGLLTLAEKPMGILLKRPPKFTKEVHYLINRWRYYRWDKAKTELKYNPRGFDQILEECLHLGAC